MPPMIVWLSILGGVLFMFLGWRPWAEGKQEESRSRRWDSVTWIALGLCQWFVAIGYLGAPPAFDFWLTLTAVSLLFGVGALFIGMTASIR